MHPLRHLTATMLLFVGLIAATFSARAAQSYDNCTGFIDTLPTIIDTEGTWCLRHDLSTSITSGQAITIATNNVNLDCNDFKIGGLAAGTETLTTGIYANNRLNIVVRHCNIRGFHRGVSFTGSSGGGHLVEDNRFDGNTNIGIEVQGDGSVVRRNQVNDSGGGTYSRVVYGILAVDAVDVLDNTVSGVLPSANSNGNGSATGILTSSNPSGSVSGNRVRGLVKIGTGGVVIGINNNYAGRISLRGNQVSGDGSADSVGLRCTLLSADALAITKDNIISGFATPTSSACFSHTDMRVP